MKKRVTSLLMALVLVLSAVNYVNPASAWENLPKISSSCYIRAYTLTSSGRAYPYTSKTSNKKDTSHWINRANDECHIIDISGDRVLVDYPNSKGHYGTARWFATSEFFKNGNIHINFSYTSDWYSITYRREGGNNRYGQIYKGDKVYVLNTTRSNEPNWQVLYKVDAKYGGGYKLAWM